jgi:hypothetical protein
LAGAREGIELDVSTLADWVGACAATLMPLGRVFLQIRERQLELFQDSAPLRGMAELVMPQLGDRVFELFDHSARCFASLWRRWRALSRRAAPRASQ